MRCVPSRPNGVDRSVASVLFRARISDSALERLAIRWLKRIERKVSCARLMLAYVLSVLQRVLCPSRDTPASHSALDTSHSIASEWITNQWVRVVLRYVNFCKVRTDWGLLGHWLQRQKRASGLALTRGATLIIHTPSNPRRIQ
jgi:hypothetical protein